MRHTFALSLMLAAAATAATAQQTSQRRGFFGVSLGCSDCYIIRAPGRVAYAVRPWVSSVNPDGAAARAGVQRGDTLIAIDGLDLTTPEGFERWAHVQPGQSIRITARRDGQERDLTLVLGDQPGNNTGRQYYASALNQAQRRGFDALRSAFRSPLGWLGMGLECEGCSISFGIRGAARFRTPPTVLTVDVDGPAHRAGLRRGDTLTAIDGSDLTSTEGGRLFAAIEPGQRVNLTVRRGGRERTVTLTAVARPDASPGEIAAFEEYSRGRDSLRAEYRDSLAEALRRAQSEMRDLERQMRDSELSRGRVDSTRRRLASLDSVLRSMRGAELAASGGIRAPLYVVPRVDVRARTFTVPLRYSGRLGELVNVEARAAGAVSVDEIGENEIVVRAGDVVVRITRRGATADVPEPPSPAPPALPAPPAPAPRPRPE